eukprot:scaffold7582_cov72-Phaeocystis_antarctica.AAC.3
MLSIVPGWCVVPLTTGHSPAAAPVRGVLHEGAETCTLLLWWPALRVTSRNFFRACDCEGNPADECGRVERPPGALPQYHVGGRASQLFLRGSGD